jgi:hypothetical protein
MVLHTGKGVASAVDGCSTLSFCIGIYHLHAYKKLQALWNMLGYAS